MELSSRDKSFPLEHGPRAKSSWQASFSGQWTFNEKRKLEFGDKHAEWQGNTMKIRNKAVSISNLLENTLKPNIELSC